MKNSITIEYSKFETWWAPHGFKLYIVQCIRGAFTLLKYLVSNQVMKSKQKEGKAEKEEEQQ